MHLSPALLLLILRISVPLVILRWPLFGGIVAVLLDNWDWYFRSDLVGNEGQYQLIDKTLDLLYLSFEALIVFTWKNRFAKLTALSLFFYRFVGYVLFTFTGFRYLLFIFPNIFENFFLAYLLYQKVIGQKLTSRQILILLVIVAIPKIIQEYLVHVIHLLPWQVSPFQGMVGEAFFMLAYVLVPIFAFSIFSPALRRKLSL